MNFVVWSKMNWDPVDAVGKLVFRRQFLMLNDLLENPGHCHFIYMQCTLYP